MAPKKYTIQYLGYNDNPSLIAFAKRKAYLDRIKKMPRVTSCKYCILETKKVLRTENFLLFRTLLGVYHTSETGCVCHDQKTYIVTDLAGNILFVDPHYILTPECKGLKISTESFLSLEIESSPKATCPDNELDELKNIIKSYKAQKEGGKGR